ncbi:hypothetical protein D5086_003978 [Populus alba]|uniref:Uncharacterized protein n=1 Tax=Populus alba TaxID=43335 RepID=A0ACC4D6D1_POPAL
MHTINGARKLRKKLGNSSKVMAEIPAASSMEEASGILISSSESARRGTFLRKLEREKEEVSYKEKKEEAKSKFKRLYMLASQNLREQLIL